MEIISTWELDFNRSMFVVGSSPVPPWTSFPPVSWSSGSTSSSLLTTSASTGSTTASVTSAQPQPLMPAWAQASWVALFTGMLFVAIGGNSIVMWIVIAHRRMRSVTNYFLVNLSVADLLMAVLNCLFNFIYMLHSDWIFGIQYCKLSNFIANVTVAASVFTLTGISFDRYQAIVWPMKPRMSKTCSLVAIGVIWLTGMALAVPCLLYSSTVTYKVRGRVRTACILIWPDGKPDVSYMDFIYQVLFFVVTYLVPMLGMSCFYTGMGRVLWGSGSIGELTQRQLDSIKSKRKVVRMFILVIIIFGFCWLPYQTYFIYTHFNPGVLYKRYIQHVYLGFYWLAMANAMVNPIIYYWMNAKFRSYFKKAICGWRSYLKRKTTKSCVAESPQYADRHSNSGSRSRSGAVDEYKDANNQSTQTYDIRFSVTRQGCGKGVQSQAASASTLVCQGQLSREPSRRESHRVRFPHCEGNNGIRTRRDTTQV